MTQPTFVPISEADQVRPALHLDVPEAWTTNRPAELRIPIAGGGKNVGTPGTDAGFALRLARRSAGDLRLKEGEDEQDALVGVALIAARRAAQYGRAPSIYDVQLALALWGYLVDAPLELVVARQRAFASVSHDYVAQRALADSIPEASLRLTPAEAQTSLRAGEILVPLVVPIVTT